MIRVLRRAGRRWGALGGLVGLGLLSVAILELDYRRGLSALEAAAVALDNLTRARVAVAEAAVAWEASYAGDPTYDSTAALARLDEAAGALDDLLAGRSALLSFRSASPVEDPGLAALIQTYLDRVSEVRAAAAARPAPFDPVDQRIRLRRLVEGAQDLEAGIYREVRRQLEGKRRRHQALLVAWGGFLLMALAGYGALRSGRDRVQVRWRQAERERASAERRYSSLERVAAVGILRVDGAGVVREVSPWWGRLAGCDEKGCLGAAWWTALPERERHQAGVFWMERAALGVPFSQEVRVREESGRERWVAGRWERSPGGGEDALWVGAFVDVSEQRMLEAQLHQAQKLEAVGRLTGGLAHDFNNLLSVILTNTHLLLMDPGALGEEEREMLADVDRAAKGGRDLVKRLMGFSRKSELSLSEVDLGEAVRGAAELARKLVPASISVSVTAPEGGPLVRADARAIEQILLNLVANARDAMAGGGAIRIGVEAVVADAEFRGERPWVAPGRYGCLTVSDEGEGMDEATLEQIFEPFFTTKAEGKGTGLGLATVHGLMQQQEGHVRVYSHPGEGTTFRLYFPAVTGEAAAGEDPSPSRGAWAGAEAGRGVTILLVEDDDALRRTSARMLTRLGYRVVEAGDGEEALRRLEEHRGRVRVIVSDLSMPGMGGLELYHALRRRGETIPFVFTSGLTQSDVAERGMIPPEARFLAKPWAATQFLDVMMSLDLRAG